MGINKEEMSGAGILTPEALLEWKRQQGGLSVPVAPAKVILTPQISTIKKRKGFFTGEIKGLAGMHLCLDAAKGTYLSGGWGLGAPAMIAMCEELRVLGAVEFHLLGVCGRLNREVAEGQVVVARSAMREEGTSCHYLPADAPSVLHHANTDALRLYTNAIGGMRADFVSTDAPYRETPEKCRQWLAAGVSVVDMETSALYSFGNFYKTRVYAAAIGADSLVDGKWTMAGRYKEIQRSMDELLDKMLNFPAG